MNHTRTKNFSFESGMIYSLWLRHFLHLKREPIRWIVLLLQPLLFWLLLGKVFFQDSNIPGENPVTYAEYFYSGILVMMIIFTSTGFTMSLIEDRQSGFLQSVLVAPGSRLSFVSGIALGVTTIVLTQTALTLLIAPYAGLPFANMHWFSLFLTVSICSITFTTLGILTAWVLKSSHAYHSLLTVIIIPLWALSGAIYPLKGVVLKTLSLVNPASYAVQGVRFSLGSSYTGDFGPPFSVSLTVLLIFAVVMVTLATFLTHNVRTNNG